MMVCDLITLGASFGAAFVVRSGGFGPPYSAMLPFGHYAWILWVIAPIWIGALHWFGLYESVAYRSPARLVAAIAKSQLAAGLALFSVMYLAMRMDISRLLLETDHPISRVAEASGFGRASYLAQAFREAVMMGEAGLQMTPRRTGTDGFYVALLKRRG